ncbi:helix-turn-helix domain-containing protein, partial [Streptomyces griseus]|uniref:helix-turn-helix domain-containing protein n=1 Tax=Streptomyces griseus TaxID=1911 RepID=UPI0020C75D23
MPTEEELFDAVDALLQDEPELPSPQERARLREAAGVTQARLAQALQSTTQTVKNWENGRSEPRPPRLQAYRRLLDGWAQKYPADAALADAPVVGTAGAPVGVPAKGLLPAPAGPAPVATPPAPADPAPASEPAGGQSPA